MVFLACYIWRTHAHNKHSATLVANSARHHSMAQAAMGGHSGFRERHHAMQALFGRHLGSQVSMQSDQPGSAHMEAHRSRESVGQVQETSFGSPPRSVSNADMAPGHGHFRASDFSGFGGGAGRPVQYSGFEASPLGTMTPAEMLRQGSSPGLS